MSRERWSVEFYLDAQGRSPVAEFLAGVTVPERAKAARVLALLEQFGLRLGMPHARPVGPLWELRAGPNRMFYVAHTGRRFIVLHGYRKQGQKAPQREIGIATQRWQDFLEMNR